MKIQYRQNINLFPEENIEDFSLFYFSGRYFYLVSDKICREMEFKKDGTIGIGSGEYEKRWEIKDGIIKIYGNAGHLCDLIKQEDKKLWCGPWIKNTKHNVKLFRVKEPLFLEEKTKFSYMTVLYNAKNKDRADEYFYCLKKNIELKEYISDFYVLYDTSNDDKDVSKNYIKNELNKIEGLHIRITPKRPMYSDMVRWANSIDTSNKIILANADIYFDDTLKFLLNYNFDNKIITLTRHEEDGGLNNHFGVNGYTDVWIFSLPIKKFYCDFVIGTQTCEVAFAYRAVLEAGYTACNPCYTINAWHRHASGIRNTPWMGYVPTIRVMAQEL